VKTTNEIIMRAPDLERVRAHYEGVLGFPVVLEKDGMIGFDTGALNLYFERGEPNGSVFEFAVDSLDDAKERLASAGCEIVEENPAIPRVYVRDRFGLVFNLNDE
jgi:catechol 2,3-dioxygenase-like lactoylglutathione lyase family enzyme